jgi:hypothetical protein
MAIWHLILGKQMRTGNGAEQSGFRAPLYTRKLLTLLGPRHVLAQALLSGWNYRQGVGIVRCIEKLLIACASMNLDSCYSAR